MVSSPTRMTNAPPPRPDRAPAGSPRTSRLAVQEAAVALVLRRDEVLLVRRALRAGDPWSGDMALPGGRRGPDDIDAIATAIRETREEVGLELARAEVRGALRPVYTVAPARLELPWIGRVPAWPMRVSPIVFALDDARAAATIATHEVTAARWVPLATLRDPRRRTTRRWRPSLLGRRITVAAPAWDLDGDVVWGLTYMMLGRFLRTSR